VPSFYLHPVSVSSFCLNAAFKKKAMHNQRRKLVMSAKTPSGKILVVGATGTVGAPLVAELLARGEKVKAATRNTAARLPAGAEAVTSISPIPAPSRPRSPMSTASMRSRRLAAPIRWRR
jgi:hypothetical protein